MVSKRHATAEQDENIGFFLTQEEKQLMIVGLDLGTGEEVGSIPMTEKTPEFTVDALSGRVYYFAKEGRLQAFDFGSTGE